MPINGSLLAPTDRAAQRNEWRSLMAAQTNIAGKEPARREVQITRNFAAPRAQLFQAWLDPKQLAIWWGPHGFTNPVCDTDARPGGALRIVMRAPDGVEYPMTGVFNAIVPPERIVFTSVARDSQDNPLLEATTTVNFAEQDGKTKLTLQASAVGIAASAPQRLAGMDAGWTQSLEKLSALIENRAKPNRSFACFSRALRNAPT